MARIQRAKKAPTRAIRSAPKRRERSAAGRREAGPARLALVVAEFHRAISDAMLEAARDEAATLGARIVQTHGVPGAYETPLVAQALLAIRDIDAVVVLGFIERGETLHGEVMGHVVHRALLELGLRANKPVGLGIIGPGATLPQAEIRKEPAARAAVRAAVRSLAALAAVTRRADLQ